jgi:hypothetical protein
MTLSYSEYIKLGLENPMDENTYIKSNELLANPVYCPKFKTNEFELWLKMKYFKEFPNATMESWCRYRSEKGVSIQDFEEYIATL